MGELNWLPLGHELSKRISGEKGREKEGVRCNAIETKGSFNPPLSIYSNLLLSAALTGGENSDRVHTSLFKLLIWLCLKFAGIKANQRLHGWEF